MNTSKSLKSILWTIPENHDGRTNEQVIDEASAAIVEAVEGLKPKRRTIDNDHEYAANYLNKGYNQAVKDFSKAIKEWQ